MTTTFCIVGGGAMGTACASVLAESPDHAVRLWMRNPDFAAQVSSTRENERLLPGVRLPDSIKVSNDGSAVLPGADVVVVCVPTRGIRDALTLLKPVMPMDAVILSTAKGIENETLLCPSEMIQQVLGERVVVALGGPCHAEEVACGKPASVVAACQDIASAEAIQTAFSSSHLRVYSSSDTRGVELAAALKNVIAIAAGISDGLRFGDNAKSALITRGLAEMVRFGAAMGAVPETFYGLAGIGDLMVTAGSHHSRNRHVGELLGRGMTLAEIQGSMEAVAEGVFTARSINTIAVQQGIDMPIARQVYRVLFEGKCPREATLELMQRPLREE